VRLLSDICLKQAQFNAVVPSQIKVDRVGLFEPTTSAHNVLYFVVQSALDEGKLVQISESISLSSLGSIFRKKREIDRDMGRRMFSEITAGFLVAMALLIISAAEALFAPAALASTALQEQLQQEAERFGQRQLWEQNQPGAEYDEVQQQ
jgi:hypothetical protein